MEIDPITSHPIISFLAVLTVIAQLGILFLASALLFRKKSHWLSSQLDKIRPEAFSLSFMVVLTATVGSLILSEYLALTPCRLCWFQRIFMYPQLVLLGLGIYRKDANIRDYLISLSGIGALIALYHYKLQMWSGGTLVPCSAVPGESCSNKTILEFGYITIPLMALTAFIAVILLLVNQRTSK